MNCCSNTNCVEPVASSSSIHHKPFDTASDSLPTRSQLKEIEIDEEDDTDALLLDLENELDDDFLGGFRERRMEEMRAQIQTTQKMKESDYGKYTEFKIEKDVIAITAKAKRSVIHFFHRDFRRCKIMDQHLEKLAAKHFDTLFIKVEVSNVPFLVTKMEVQVLPCVVGFVGGVSKMKIIGFEEFEGGDDFATSALELTMVQCDVIDPNPTATLATMRALQSTSNNGRGNGPRRGIRSRQIGSDEDSE